jgi:hypothetical protein
MLNWAGCFGGENYAVAPDGQHFIMIRSKEAAAAANNPFMSRNERQIDVVLNLFDELKQRVPMH